MERLTKMIKQEAIRQVLDIGTGDGHFVKTLSELFPVASFTGIDPSEEAIQTARLSFPDVKYRFETMNAENIAFPNESFDMSTISNALHHLASPEKALSEMKRVTRKGGWLVISEIISDGLNPAQLNQQLYHHHRSKIDRLSGIVHRETYSREEVLALIKVSHLIPFGVFDYERKDQPERNPDKLQQLVSKMEQHQSKAEGFPEFDDLKAWLESFKERVMKEGFQPATNFVVVIRNNN
jgi:SAM-dependent methyltransferase